MLTRLSVPYGIGSTSLADYTPYASTSINIAAPGQPDGSSRLCLSCHDGTIAIGSVLDLPGMTASGTLDLTDSGSGILTGEGKLAPSQTGFTTHIGINLTNDHPVSFLYDSALATLDGELVDPASSTFVGKDYSFPLPLDSNEKLQCFTCHDPHSEELPKFLRMPLTQTVESAAEGTDAIICLSCHNKEDLVNGGWMGSAHQELYCSR